jgi:phospholipase/carboxylesterase
LEENLNIDGIQVRIRRPDALEVQAAILLLHGWTGDEYSMQIFESRLPQNVIMISPRGLYPTPLGGFSWQENFQRKWPLLSDLSPAVARLMDMLVDGAFRDADLSQFSVVGFSQGAALAYTLACLHPRRISRLAGLSGFIPDDMEPILQGSPLIDMPVFVAHGSKDELVPVDKARSAVETLEKGGARVTYCEDAVGHKLSANCFRGLEAFFAQLDCS